MPDLYQRIEKMPKLIGQKWNSFVSFQGNGYIIDSDSVTCAADMASGAKCRQSHSSGAQFARQPAETFDYRHYMPDSPQC